MTPIERYRVALLAWFDRLEADGLRCGYVSYWCDTLTPLPEDIDRRKLHPDEWDADFEVLHIPDRLGWVRGFLSNHPDFILVLEQAHGLKVEAEVTLADLIAEEAMDGKEAEGGDRR